MPSTLSPLRYPGGKTKLYSLVSQLLENNNLLGCTYIEPFCGGAGLALKLLFNNDVQTIVLNDKDPAIYAFWHSVLFETDEFCRRVNNAILSIDEWNLQKDIYNHLRPLENNQNLLDLGYATLFLNRTNMSGIIKGGVIGGTRQNGNYKMDARFTKSTLIKKITRIGALRNRIELYDLDASDLIAQVIPNIGNPFVNFDPPYVNKGSVLYENSFNEDDHRVLSTLIAECQCPWIVTYDNCVLIQDLYRNFQKGVLDICYSIGFTKQAKEIIIYSPAMVTV